ncbi:MAG: methyl-accepting chemotaxis protein [Balneolales bacterium]|nr:methyl-accepting chemotaxis protein [Balneolales bacterium]
MSENVEIALQIRSVISELQKERGRSVGYTATQDSEVYQKLVEQRLKTDDAIANIVSDYENQLLKSQHPEITRQFEDFILDTKTLTDLRNSVDAQKLEEIDYLVVYNNHILKGLDIFNTIAKNAADHHTASNLLAYYFFLDMKDALGQERAILYSAFLKNEISIRLYGRYAFLKDDISFLEHEFEQLADREIVEYYKSKVDNPVVRKADEITAIFDDKTLEGNYGVNPEEWFSTITAKIGFYGEIDAEIASYIRTITQNALQVDTRLIWLELVLSLLAVSVMIALTYSVIESTLSGLVGISKSLVTNSVNTNISARSLNKTSEDLAQSTSQQSAALEETSATFEEMFATANSNSENAEHAKDSANSMREAAEQGATKISQLNVAMEDIKTSSDSISSIIKTIDDIAFQTNLLALNAAVEAARAGEAGKGFAVVAEEVRSLAQRSAQAARKTAEEIETSIANSNRGVSLNSEIKEVFDEILTQARNVDQTIAGIAASSYEQTKGIEDVKKTVEYLDSKTQKNAAIAEETATSAHELTDEVRSLVNSLNMLSNDVVGGKLGRELFQAIHAADNNSENVIKAHKVIHTPAPSNQEEELNTEAEHKLYQAF